MKPNNSAKDLRIVVAAGQIVLTDADQSFYEFLSKP
jgi:hypothetical protein